MEEFKDLYNLASEVEKAAREGEEEFFNAQKRQRARISSAYGDFSKGFKVYGVNYTCQCGAIGFYESSDPFVSFRCQACGLEVKL